jgi:chemotaxis protein CheD
MNYLNEAMKNLAEPVNRATLAVSGAAESELKQVYLHPGDLYASPEPAKVMIILGSCVAVCLYNPRLAIGGATHFLLPTLEGEGNLSPRYGNVAIERLLQELRLAGSKNKDLHAELYGGASVLQAFSSGANGLIGEKNVRLAVETLSREAIPIMRRDTGGSKGRKINMRTDTGAITCKLIGS